MDLDLAMAMDMDLDLAMVVAMAMVLALPVLREIGPSIMISGVTTFRMAWICFTQVCNR